jgi:hypothetical protein
MTSTAEMKSPAWGAGLIKSAPEEGEGGQAPKGKDTISHEALPANYTLVCGKLPRRCDKLPQCRVLTHALLPHRLRG